MTQITANFSNSLCERPLAIDGISDFDLAETLDCGQAFRWNPAPDGSFTGVAAGRACRVARRGNELLLYGVPQEDYDRFWFSYFDLGRNYRQIKQELSADPVLARAVAYAPGIRVLNQDPWEALASFIISQNNNVKRIKGIIERLCALCGEPIEGGFYAFPTPEALAARTPEDLAPVRAGFRARYLIDAAQKAVSRQIDLAALRTLPLPEAREMLMRITGVGVKVAECALLFGCGRVECFPVDVWIGRVMRQLFPDGLPACAAGYEGIAQQYLFHYARTSGML
ncbi:MULTISPECIES: DNA-3-methyladenine glycosylase family protein [Anaerotruncus]|jgi:N-glycosylase/DNA lyase|uniref:DNA-3-methyladenine glycosylase family protein n=1 Tax=Anaerotruncus TaxID=244127 RepID=UPI0009ACD15F|nr:MULTISPECIES: DNA glycosylase [Anaerotruncus]RGX54243.1 DNA-3-methyladenine glycosylase 2 family protein [Anaerotruncus sp. AF02-27]